MNVKTILKRKVLVEAKIKKLLDKLEKETACSISGLSCEKVANILPADPTVEGARASLATVNVVEVRIDLERK